jgi:hypothetical protein
MNVSTIETHEVVKNLISVGVTDVQAEAVTRHLRSVQEVDLSDLATKADLAALGKDLRAEMAAIAADLRADTAALRAEMQVEFAKLRIEMGRLETATTAAKVETIRWVFGLALAQAGLTFALLRLIH